MSGMYIDLADQTLSFLGACLLGAILGLLYDVFRILRIAVPVKRGVVFVQDLLFWLVAAAASFLYLLENSNGVVRVFLLIGELIGGTLYQLTVGRLVMRVAQAVINAVKAALGFIFRYLVMPVWRFVYTVISFLLRPLRFLGHIFKNYCQRVKFRLKVRRMVLYNHLIGFLNSTLQSTLSKEKNEYGNEASTKRQAEKGADP